MIFKIPSKINTDLFIEASEMEPALWNVNSEEYQNRNMRTKSLKKLAEQFNVSGGWVIIYYYFVFSFWNCSYASARIQQTFIWEVWREFSHFFRGDIKSKINTLCSYYSKELAKTTNKKRDLVQTIMFSQSGNILTRSHFYMIPTKQERVILHWKVFIQTCLAIELFQMYWNRDKSYLWFFTMACVVIASS